MAQPAGILEIGADVRGEDKGKLKQFQDIKKGEKQGGMTYPDASLRVLWVGESNAGHAIRFFVKEHDVSDIPDSGTFFPYILLDLQHGGGIFLRMLLAIAMLRDNVDERWGDRTDFKLFEREEVF